MSLEKLIMTLIEGAVIHILPAHSVQLSLPTNRCLEAAITREYTVSGR